jgi:hypothetical protein
MPASLANHAGSWYTQHIEHLTKVKDKNGQDVPKI